MTSSSRSVFLASDAVVNCTLLSSGPAWKPQLRLPRLPSRRDTSSMGKYRPIQHKDKTSPFADDSENKNRIRIMRRQTLYVGAGLVIFFGSMWATASYVSGEPEAPSILPGEDVSNRYKDIAPGFDKSVDSTEFWMGIGWLRKWLLAKAHGNVLEVSVGTGRNSRFYKEEQCSSITMIDLSSEMIEVAQQRFKGMGN